MPKNLLAESVQFNFFSYSELCKHNQFSNISNTSKGGRSFPQSAVILTYVLTSMVSCLASLPSAFSGSIHIAALTGAHSFTLAT